MRRHLPRGIFLGLSVILMSLACVSIDSKASKKTTRPDWPAEMRLFLETHEYQYAWGLFSSSGLEDDGQIMIYAFPADTGPAFAQIVKRGESAITTQRKLSVEEWKKIKTQLKVADKFENFDGKSFDGIQYHFEHIGKKDGAFKVLHSFAVNNPEVGGKEAQKYVDFIKALQALRK